MNQLLQYVGLQGSDGSGLEVEDICHMTEHLGEDLGDGHKKTTQQEIGE